MIRFAAMPPQIRKDSDLEMTDILDILQRITRDEMIKAEAEAEADRLLIDSIFEEAEAEIAAERAARESALSGAQAQAGVQGKLDREIQAEATAQGHAQARIDAKTRDDAEMRALADAHSRAEARTEAQTDVQGHAHDHVTAQSARQQSLRSTIGTTASTHIHWDCYCGNEHYTLARDANRSCPDTCSPPKSTSSSHSNRSSPLVSLPTPTLFSPECCTQLRYRYACGCVIPAAPTWRCHREGCLTVVVVRYPGICMGCGGSDEEEKKHKKWQCGHVYDGPGMIGWYAIDVSEIDCGVCKGVLVE